ncbi:MAG: hypothetical protein NC388_09720 [Clostridium sp.]|nr:hypothetical protein [Clostridium sp.]
MLYFEDGHPRPLTRVNDTTLVIQKYGSDYTWSLNRSMSEKRMAEIRDIIANDNMDVEGELMSYVLSTTERELQTTNDTLRLLLVVMVVGVIFILEYLVRMKRHKREVEARLQAITEESSRRPEPICNALRQVEEEFLHSPLYQSVRRRVESGDMLRPDDWEELECGMRPVYAHFFSQLPALCKMSLLERRVCLLIKLRFSPSEMAAVLCKDISTISSIRSRLFKKVFQRSGGSKDWDEFILSL